jgi:hypothetical protein
MTEASEDKKHGKSEPSSLDAEAISGLIRQELDRNNKYLEFAQGQIQKDRDFYKHLYTLASLFLALMIGVGIYLTSSSLSQMRADMKASIESEAKALHAQAEATKSEATTTVSRELANVHAEVQNRLNTEFKSEAITELIAKAAKERTDSAITGIIHEETARQVSLGIQEQAPEIKKNVEEETRNAVKALQPTITGIISDQLQAEVKNAVAPVEATMKAYLNLNVLSALARNDDREAFDQLMAMGNGEAAGDIKTLAAATALEVVREKTNVFRRLGRQFKEKQTPQAMLNIIGTSTFIPDRLTALDNYPPDDVSILPVLVKIIRSDQNLEMVATAFSSFDSRTKQEFQFPDYAGVVSWWDKNHDQFDHKQAQ